MSDTIAFKDIVAGAIALVSAFGGAWAAFRFQENRNLNMNGWCQVSRFQISTEEWRPDTTCTTCVLTPPV